MPTYLVKWKAELLWVAALLANGVVIGFVLKALGVDDSTIAAVEAVALALSRLIYGFLLPTPTESQAVDSVRDALPDGKLGR